jgi:hypothetical protein
MVACPAKRLSSSTAKTAAAETTLRTRKDARSKRRNVHGEDLGGERGGPRDLEVIKVGLDEEK